MGADSGRGKVIMAGRATRSLAVMPRVTRALSILLLAGVFNADAQVLSLTANYLRSRVEEWPEPQRSKVLPFLDECRRSADNFAQVWLKEDGAAIFSMMSPEQPMTRADSDSLLNQMRATFGSIMSVEYRSQSLLLTLGDSPALLQHPYAQVDYAITTTQSNGVEYFFHVYLSRVGGMCRTVTAKYEKYLNAVPPWLQRHDAKKGHDG